MSTASEMSPTLLQVIQLMKVAAPAGDASKTSFAAAVHSIKASPFTLTQTGTSRCQVAKERVVHCYQKQRGGIDNSGVVAAHRCEEFIQELQKCAQLLVVDHSELVKKWTAKM